ncbi:hypothetical protein SAMN04488245_10811 [Alloyangia pacifica]|uniref:Uncharacterized protein n=2 Tax=Alloyangia pacifica TaxID=311180 RepID=A0A1I6P3T6_9RHOB|nr:hypothetical protein SAMN04488245_10811 [Alloyangia pacifica]SFS34750.1 hypothetical protein SAMN04488050_101292 [Alloyangia pacifica]
MAGLVAGMGTDMERSDDIRPKLEKLEQLFARGATPGERAAAGADRGRLAQKLGSSADEKQTALQ